MTDQQQHHVQMIMGYGGQDPEYLMAGQQRVSRRQLHRDHSLVMVCPTRGMIPAYVVDSWLSLAGMPNQPRTNVFVRGMEVGAAYNFAIEQVLAHPTLSGWRWLLTMEEDNVPPPFGLIDLCTTADDLGYQVLGGLYWTKGLEGVPQVWGDRRRALNFAPWSPWQDDTFDYTPGQVVDCWGTGMGFTLFDLDLFRSTPGPWFTTAASPTEGICTQDLWFAAEQQRDGRSLRVGVHTGVKVLHYDHTTGIGY